MNLLVRALMVLLGIFLLAPGLCFLGFGTAFLGGILQYFDPMTIVVSLAMVGIGGLIIWGAVLLIINYSKPGK